MKGRSRWARFAAFAVLFAALVAIGVAWTAPSHEELSAARAHVLALPAPLLALLVAMGFAGFGVEALRFVVFARLVGVRLGWRAALETTIANHLFSWIMPGVSMGEPVAVYVLVRHGVPVEEAVIATFAKLLTSVAFIFGLTFALLAAGVGPPLPTYVDASLVVFAGSAAIVVIAMIAGGLRPRTATAIVDRTERALSGPRVPRRVARAASSLAARTRRSVELLAAARIGSGSAVLVLLVHALYYGLFVAPLVTLAVALGAPFGKVSAAAIVYQGVIYLAPTPAGAGVGEATAVLFFGSLLPRASAFLVVLVFRALTYYLHIAVGLLTLPFSRALRSFLSRPGAPRTS